MPSARGLITEAMYSTELVDALTNEAWLAPAGDLLFTPQQDIIVWGVDMSSLIQQYTTQLAVAESNLIGLTVQLTRAAGANADGVICELKNYILETLQAAITPNTIGFKMSENKYVQLPKGLKVMQNESLGIWLRRSNQHAVALQMEQLTIIHYELAA